MKRLYKTNIFTCAALTAALCLSAAAYAEGGDQIMTAEEPQIAPIAVSPAYNPDTDSLPQLNDSVKSADPFADSPMGTGTVKNLQEYWEKNGYPDYVSYAGQLGLASYDPNTQTESVYGLWTVGVVNATEEQKQEIISLVSSEYHVKLEEANYSYAYRAERAEKICQSYPKAKAELSEASENIYIYNNGYTDEEWLEIVKAYEDGVVINGGVYYDESFVGVPELGAEGIGEAVPSNEIAPAKSNEINEKSDIDEIKSADAAAPTANNGAPTVGIDGSNGAAPEGGLITALPGAAVDDGDELSEEGGLTGGNKTAAMLPAVQKKADPIYMWIFISAVSVLTAASAAFIILRRAKKNAQAVTSAGSIVTLSPNPTKAEIVKAIKDSQAEPDDDTFRKIMEEINK